MCLSDQLVYKQIFVTEYTIDSCFNQTTFYFFTIVSSQLLYYS
jgi:hypothetical protein